MEKVKENLEYAYKLLSHVVVSGDSVDILAAARGHLRSAYKELNMEGDEVGR